MQSTYFPAQSTGYVPPHPSSSDPFPQDSPFAGTSMGYGSSSVPSASGQQQPEVVPAVMPTHSAPHAGPASGDTVLHFQGGLLPVAWQCHDFCKHPMACRPMTSAASLPDLSRSQIMSVRALDPEDCYLAVCRVKHSFIWCFWEGGDERRTSRSAAALSTSSLPISGVLKKCNSGLDNSQIVLRKHPSSWAS